MRNWRLYFTYLCRSKLLRVLVSILSTFLRTNFFVRMSFWQLFLVTFWLWQKNCTKNARVKRWWNWRSVCVLDREGRESVIVCVFVRVCLREIERNPLGMKKRKQDLAKRISSCSLKLWPTLNNGQHCWTANWKMDWQSS